MADLGTYQVPKELKDEDKWFRWFTKKQLLFVGVALGAGIVITTACYRMGIMAVGLSISEIILLVALFLAFVPIPVDRYMIGGGYSVYAILMRIVIKNLRRNKVLYVKNYEHKEEY